MTESAERAQVGWRFWLLWVLASTAGFVVSSTWALHVAEAVQGAMVGIVGGRPGAVSWSLMGAFIGASIGIAQWFVLRRHVARAGWWVIATILAGFVGGAVLREASLLLFGVSVGIAQGIVLFWWRGSRALLWVLANVAALILAFIGMSMVLNVATDMATAGEAALTPAERGALGATVISSLHIALRALEGVIYGAITGVVMVWLLRRSVTEEPSRPQLVPGWNSWLKWVFAGIVAWAVGFAVLGVVLQPMGVDMGLEDIGIAAVAGAAFGALAGGVSVWQSRRAIEEEPNPPQDAA